jgi:hypothetical protein
MGTAWRDVQPSSSRCLHVKHRNVLLWALLLLWGCQLGTCQLELERAAEEPKVLFGKWGRCPVHNSRSHLQTSNLKRSAGACTGFARQLGFYSRLQRLDEDRPAPGPPN